MRRERLSQLPAAAVSWNQIRKLMWSGTVWELNQVRSSPPGRRVFPGMPTWVASRATRRRRRTASSTAG